MKRIMKLMSVKPARSKSKRNQKGIAMVIVMIALVLATMLGLAVASTTTLEVQIANAAESSSKTFYYAETGLNMAVSMIKRMNGDFNDLLAGPPETGFTSIAQRLRTHGNEFVISNGTSSTVNGWPTTSILLPSSNLNVQMFSSDVKGFNEGNTADIEVNGDGILKVTDVYNSIPTALSSQRTILNPTSSNMKWGGKLDFAGSGGSKYVVLIEVYDDDDPLARIFDAYPQGLNGAAGYPKGYTGSTSGIAPIYKVPGADPTNAGSYNSYDNCGKDFIECPGQSQTTGGANETTKYGSFSAQNKDRNSRVLIRSTARQIAKINSVDTIVSETVLDTIVGFFPYPAVITNGCATVAGSTDILGTYGGIHANEGLCLGNAIRIDQTATSSTSVCVSCPGNPPAPCPPGGGGGYICGFSAGNQPLLVIPDLNPITVAGDPNPPAPLHAPSGTYNGVAGTTDGGFWIRDVVDLGNTFVDERDPANFRKRGVDIVLISPTGASGSRRTQILNILGITAGHLTNLENLPGSNFNKNHAIIVERTGFGLPLNAYRIASALGATIDGSDWFFLNVSTGAIGTWSPLIFGVGQADNYGWSAGGGTTASTCGASSCNASCTKPNGAVHATNGVTWTPSDLEDLNDKIFFIDGNAIVTSNLGKFLVGGLKTTWITTGFIDGQGTPDLTGKLQADLTPIAPPFTAPRIMFLAGTDIDLRGDVGAGLKFDGIAYAREQVTLSGSSSYQGQVVAGDFSHDDGHTCYNLLTGSATVTFSGNTAALGAIKSTSWRILKF